MSRARMRKSERESHAPRERESVSRVSERSERVRAMRHARGRTRV